VVEQVESIERDAEKKHERVISGGKHEQWEYIYDGQVTVTASRFCK
jgi:hypothetical protein